MKMRRIGLLIVLLLVLLVCGAASATTYTIQDLGTLGGYYTYAYGINSAGTVVGISDLDGSVYRGFQWTGGTISDLGTLGGYFGSARSINDSGQVVGYSETADYEQRAFIYQGNVMTDLGTLGGPYSCATAINNAGVVTGSSYTADGDYHAFLWQNGQMVDLGTLGGSMSQAFDLNSQAMVAGSSSAADGSWHAVIWQNGNIVDLNLCGTTYAVNDAGTAVGYAFIGDSYVGFKYSGGQTSVLPALGGIGSQAFDINTNGQIVGQASLPDGTTAACLWENGAAVDLSTAIPADTGWLLVQACAINDSGSIVGWGLLKGETRSFLLTPVPELPLQVVAGAQPGSPTIIKLRDKKPVGIAILASGTPGASDYFDPRKVSVDSIRFAGASVAKSGASYLTTATDVNGDQMTDLVVYVYPRDMSLAQGDTLATLDGETGSGRKITAQVQVIVRGK